MDELQIGNNAEFSISVESSGDVEVTSVQLDLTGDFVDYTSSQITTSLNAGEQLNVNIPTSYQTSSFDQSLLGSCADIRIDVVLNTGNETIIYEGEHTVVLPEVMSIYLCKS
jgi:hypothetical protein